MLCFQTYRQGRGRGRRLPLVKLLAETSPALLARFWELHEQDVSSWMERKLFEQRFEPLIKFGDGLSLLLVLQASLPELTLELQGM